jgi:hypothetical protein
MNHSVSMKIFISWSGQRSKAVAILMSDWIKCVIQATRPWISTRDIDRGAIWFSEISDHLKSTTAGIVCLTQENKNRPWILFETGALAKGLTTNRVCTFLIDLQPSDLEDPLAQFNHTTREKGSMWELVRSLNAIQEDKGLDEHILEKVFNTYWPQFESAFANALEENKETENAAPRSESDILKDILDNTRNLSQRIRDIESRINVTKEPMNNGIIDIGHNRKDVIKIVEMMRKGESDQSIVSAVIDFDMPENYILSLIDRIRRLEALKQKPS